MSIAHELSSEVAEAVLARRQDESPQRASELTGMLKEVYSTLRRLNAETRRLRLRPRETDPPELEAAAAAE